jgi:dipeptidase
VHETTRQRWSRRADLIETNGMTRGNAVVFADLHPQALMEIAFLWQFAQQLIWKRDRKVTLQLNKKSVLILIDSQDGDLL